MPRKQHSRERGYTDAEALKILQATRSHEPYEDETGRIREVGQTTAAKRWVPLLAAFTGARVSEITQLRKQDVRANNGRWIVRTTPDAGTLKVGNFRDVPLHSQVIELGFLEFVQAAKDGPLFHTATDPEKFKDRAAMVQYFSSNAVEE